MCKHDDCTCLFSIPCYGIMSLWIFLTWPNNQAYSEYCILYLFALWLHYIVRGPVQPILVKAALASALNDRDTQWLILSSSPIDNHNVTSSGITSTALRAGEKRSRAVSPDRVEVKHERSRNKMVFYKWENGEKPCQQTRTSQRRAKHDSLPLRQAAELAFKLLRRIVIWCTQRINARVNIS